MSTTWSGKGDNPRPRTVSNEQYEANWDRIFGKKEPQPLREVTYDGMWKHSCTVEMAVVWIGKNETCDYCGAWEEDNQ